MIVPTLRVGMQPGTLRVPPEPNAERPWRHYHAERGNDQWPGYLSQVVGHPVQPSIFAS